MLRILIISASFACAFSSPVERIVNGTNARPGEIPYIVSLRYDDSHICGASILNDRWILTAAHCVLDTDISVLSIQFGVTRISTDKSFSTDLEKIIIHPGYLNVPGYINDISLLKVKDRIPLGSNVQPTILPTPFNATPAGSEAVLAGWGYPYSDGEVMQTLQVVHIMVFSDDDCERLQAEDGPTDRYYHICAGVPEGGKGQCSGDSGGPLTVDGIQVGIVSWSVKPCAIAGYPGVFTKVSTFMEWIIQTLMADV